MKSLGNHLYRIASYVLFVTFGIVILYLFFLSNFVTCFMAYEDEHVFFVKDLGPLMLIGLGFFLLLLTVITKKCLTKGQTGLKPSKKALVVTTTIFALFMVWWVSAIHLPPIYDQAAIFECAQDFLQQDYTNWQPGAYMHKFPFQNGMVLMFLPFAALGKVGVYAYQYYNIILFIAVCLGFLKISRIYFGERTAHFVYYCALFCIPMWGQITYVYGFLGQIACSIWGIYFLIRFEREERTSFFWIANLLFQIGILYKTNGQVFVIAGCISLFLYFCKTGKTKYLFTSLGLGTTMWLCGILLNLFFTHTTGQSVTDGISLWGYFATGLKESSIAPGWFSDYHTLVYSEHIGDTNAMNQIYKSSITDSWALFAQEPSYGFRFFARKLASMWADPAMQFFTNTSIRNLEGTLSYAWKDLFYNGGVLNTVITLVLDVLQALLYFGTILWLIHQVKNRRIAETLQRGHLLIVFLGGFLYHMLGEAQGYYVLPYYMFLIPYAIDGYKISIQDSADYKLKSTTAYTTIVLFVLSALLYVLPSTWLDNSVRIGTDTSEYIYYLQTHTEWKDATYIKR